MNRIKLLLFLIIASAIVAILPASIAEEVDAGKLIDEYSKFDDPADEPVLTENQHQI
jgi:hypothetical protein